MAFFGSKSKKSRSQQAVATMDSANENGPDSDIKGLSDLYCPAEDSPSQLRDVADVLVQMGVLDAAKLANVRQQQKKKRHTDIEQIITELNLAEPQQILQAQAQLYGFEFRAVDVEKADGQIFARLELDYIRANRIVPVGLKAGKLVVATSRPADLFVIEDVRRQTKMDLDVVVCPDADIDRLCERFAAEAGSQAEDGSSVDDIISDMTEVEVVADDQKKDVEDLEKMAGQSPVIKFVNYVISSAIRDGASDIHIEPRNKQTKVRYRIDGVLFEVTNSPSKMHSAIVSRIKIMSNLDISERRLPQDGKVAVIVGGRQIDLRISVLPTSHGEKVVIRILDSKSIIRGLETLGMEPDVCEHFREQIAAPHGILLVTGPTGSGKSTTLYSALCQMDGKKLNISTVEDPVEYELDFCNQVQANEKIGLDFAASLRSLLRQDPDIIMIGEIRDNETARIAVQAALTGHLVLATLHTNDAPSSVTRLVNIGVDSYLIAASMNAALAQRLVRKICPNCKHEAKITANIKKMLARANIDVKKLYEGKGCEKCRQSGYAGRVGIYELFVIDDAVRDVINADPSAQGMRRAFAKCGRDSLFDDGIKKAKAGLTTIEEVLRVTEGHSMGERDGAKENAK